MSLNNLLTMTVDISRTTQGPGITTKYGVIYEAVPTMIQPIVDEFYGKTGMNYDKSYKAFFPMGTDIIISDKVTDNFGINYQVTGILNRPYGSGAVQHITVTLTEEVGAGVVVE